MKKKGFTLIELLVVVALIGVLVSVGSLSIKKQAESRAMIRVQNEIGDFFRVAAKRSLETGKKYRVHFDLLGKEIEIYREEEEEDGVGNGTWEDGGIKIPIEKLGLPNVFEYEKITSLTSQDFLNKITSNGNMSSAFTLYVFKSNSQSEIQGDEVAKYAIRFTTNDKHVKFLHVKEYVPNSEITEVEIQDGKTASTNSWDIIKSQ